ncbi:mechanosensitive ion channel family protein [Pseudomonas aeruginosa]
MIGIQTTSFVAAIGAAGLAIGLALQGSLANFAGGVLILLFRPFKVGDWIEAQGVAGTVDSILIFHTVLRSGDNKRIIVPNGALSNGTVTNYSAEPLRKVIFDVGIDYDADLKNAQNILLAMADDPRVLKDPAPVAVVSNLGESAITLSLRVWVKNADYWDVMFMFNERPATRWARKVSAFPSRSGWSRLCRARWPTEVRAIHEKAGECRPFHSRLSAARRSGVPAPASRWTARGAATTSRSAAGWECPSPR